MTWKGRTHNMFLLQQKKKKLSWNQYLRRKSKKDIGGNFKGKTQGIIIYL